MIEAFSLASAHLVGDALSQQARLRFRAFVRRNHLDHPFYDGMEYDEFDTPAAVYLVWRDTQKNVRGLIRLLRTTRAHMLGSYWPHLINEPPRLPASRIWEVTRVCVDKNLAPDLRMNILPELLCGVSEYFNVNKIDAMVGVTRPHLIEHFIRQGVQWLGATATIEGQQERAFFVLQPFIRPSFWCQKIGIKEPVLRIYPGTALQRAA